ncbi:MAG: RICIN domain-containing protein [Oscillospiraceae bacterium]|nr:RICIN domain-containing protein [Oscillospiraceae bacterium]
MKIKKILSALVAVCTLAVSSLSAMPAIAANYSRVAVHDPSIIKLDDGTYYIIGSHLGAARSADLGNWTLSANSGAGTKNTTFFNDIYTDLAVPCAWSSPSNANYDLSGNLWAPDIIYNDAMGKYCMYLSVNGDYWKSSIVMCTADNIDGPYTYIDTIVYSGFNHSTDNNYTKTDVPKVLGDNPDLSRYLDSSGEWNANYGTNAIDPCVFYDEQGKLWMVYGSWFGGLFMLELDENTGLRDYNVTYQTVTNESDAYMGTKVAGGYWVSGEGAYIEYMKSPDSNKGYYYLFVSYGCFNNDGGYNMRIFRSEEPDGPYVDQNGNSAVYTAATDNIGGTVGQRLMSNYQWDCNDRPNKAQGHNSVLMDDDGKLYVIYHNKFNDTYGFHEVRVHQMILNEDEWPVATAYEYTGESVSDVGHSLEAVAGEYEFIFHKLNQTIVADQTTSGNNAEVAYSQDIVLNTDGTVSGDITGTWTMKNGSADMTLVYNGVTYKGTFIVQADESSAMTQKMTFTATGNNTCVWGSKKSEYDASVDNVDLTNTSSKLVYNASSASGTGETVYIGDTTLLSGVPYYITSKFNSMSLDLAGGATDDGANIQQWGLSGGSHQEWRIVAQEDGYCKILSMSDETKCIAVAGDDATDGLNVELQTYSGADNQLWKLVQNGTTYGVVSKCSGDLSGLDVYGWSTESGGNINQWSYWGGDCQLWNIEPVYPMVNDGTYTIKNINSGLYISESDGNIIQSQSQIFNFARQSDGTYIITDENGKALTVENNSAENGTNIYLADCDGSDSQKLTLHINKDGSYSLLTVSSGGIGCADVYGISLEDGANICQWEFWGGAGQKFVLEPAYKEEIEVSGLYGDANGDGVVNSIDATMVTRHALDVYTLSDEAVVLCDVNCDGIINSIDGTIIVRYVLKVIETLPV